MTPQRLSYQDFASRKEIEPFPGNQYEVAPGIFGVLRAPTLDVMDAYEEADRPMAEFMEALQSEDAPPKTRFTSALYEASIACVKVVLAGESGGALQVDWSRCYPPMCAVVRQHFFQLGWPIADELTKSLQAQAAPETA